MAERKNRTETLVEQVKAPAFLANIEQDDSLKGMGEYRIVPRMKVLQGLSAARLKEQFGEGAVVMVPGDSLIAQSEAPFLVVPCFQWADFRLWSDRRDQGSPAILDSSTNKRSPLALQARNADRREEEYPGGPPNKPFMKRAIEHINFVI